MTTEPLPAHFVKAVARTTSLVGKRDTAEKWRKVSRRLARMQCDPERRYRPVGSISARGANDGDT